jgi:hypothetical protein
MGNEVIGNLFSRAQGSNRTVQIAGVPQDDGRDEEVEVGRAMLLVFVGAIADFAEPMKEDGPRQTVM